MLRLAHILQQTAAPPNFDERVRGTATEDNRIYTLMGLSEIRPPGCFGGRILVGEPSSRFAVYRQVRLVLSTGEHNFIIEPTIEDFFDCFL
jgi:hypothetical protein